MKSRLHKVFETDREGFTLIEVMVAITIFAMIILMTSTVFHQATVARDTGMRKGDGSMMARAALGYMADQMHSAVWDNDRFEVGSCKMGDQSASGTAFAIFPRLDAVPETGQRGIRLVQFTEENEELQMSIWNMDSNDYRNFNVGSTPDEGRILMTNVTHLSFHSIGGSGWNRLPSAIRMTIGVRRITDVSGIGARSFGPNGKDEYDDENGDDITSY
jgi:prepilin-type N-terminal cleavage/methylation domain-containing protein